KTQVFGLTELSLTGGTQPEFKVQPASSGKGVVVSPTSALLPPIQSKFLKAGRYLDRSILNFRPSADSEFPTQVGGYLNVWEITAAGSARLQAGEQEHCDDFKLAFYMSLYRFAEVVNDLAKKGTIYSSEADARAALATQVAIDPGNLRAYFGCLAGWMQKERDNKGWHTPALPRPDSISYDSTVGQQVAIRKLDNKALP